jgi:hypothetical protein
MVPEAETLEAQGKTVVAVMADGAILGMIAMRDEAARRCGRSNCGTAKHGRLRGNADRGQ